MYYEDKIKNKKILECIRKVCKKITKMLSCFIFLGSQWLSIPTWVEYPLSRKCLGPEGFQVLDYFLDLGICSIIFSWPSLIWKSEIRNAPPLSCQCSKNLTFWKISDFWIRNAQCILSIQGNKSCLIERG